jgi:choline-glycine betaine transporter
MGVFMRGLHKSRYLYMMFGILIITLCYIYIYIYIYIIFSARGLIRIGVEHDT